MARNDPALRRAFAPGVGKLGDRLRRRPQARERRRFSAVECRGRSCACRVAGDRARRAQHLHERSEPVAHARGARPAISRDAPARVDRASVCASGRDGVVSLPHLHRGSRCRHPARRATAVERPGRRHDRRRAQAPQPRAPFVVRRRQPPPQYGTGHARRHRINAARVGRQQLARNAPSHPLRHHAAGQLLHRSCARRYGARGYRGTGRRRRRARQAGVRPEKRRQRRSRRRSGDRAKDCAREPGTT